ncbi:MAG: hypothetical protein ABIE74_08830, partial [Pseudomonadota bacterium]
MNKNDKMNKRVGKNSFLFTLLPSAGKYLAFVLLFVFIPVSALAAYSVDRTYTYGGGGTWGSILKMTASLNGSSVTFKVIKQNGSFSANNNVYLKVGTYESYGANRDNGIIYAGDNSWSSTHNLSNFSGYPKEFYFRLESTGGYAWVGPITVSYTNNSPYSASISSSPSSTNAGDTVYISVTRGTDPDGDQVKVQCTGTNSNRTDSSPYVSSWGYGGTTTSAPFVFSGGGTQTIYCTTFDNNGAKSPVANRSITVVAIPSIPNRPSATATGSTSVSVSWSSVSGASEYKLYRASSAYGNYSEIYRGSSRSYSDSQPPLYPNTTYYYMVKAGNSAGWSDYSSYQSVTTQALPPLQTPTLLSPNNGSSTVSTTPKLDWNDVAGATKYRIFVATSYSTLDSLSNTTKVCTNCIINDDSLTSSELTVPSGKFSAGNT